MKKTKIIATIGPSVSTEEKIEKLIKLGVDVFRLNFSHGDYKDHERYISLIRKVSKKLNKHIPIMQDITGPKIRLTNINDTIELKRNDEIEISENNPNSLKISHPEILKNTKEGEFVYFSDGTVKGKIIKKQKNSIVLKILVGGELHPNCGVNFPETELSIDAITEKDKRDLIFGAKHGIEIVAISFVNRKEDIKKAKEILKSSKSEPLIIAKIETALGVKNIDGILEESDGLMVARGDLGVEIGLENVPIVQKNIIRKALEKNKISIVATQMLLTMVSSPYPTRAEISDIANGVLDGADALMLSNETAIGKYPEEAIKVLASSIEKAEEIYNYYRIYDVDKEEAIALSVSELAKGMSPKAIVSFTRTGRTAKSISRFRPKTEIFALSPKEETLKKLNIVWGVIPLEKIEEMDTHRLVESFIKLSKEKRIFKTGDTVIVTMGSIAGKMGRTNIIRVIDF